MAGTVGSGISWLPVEVSSVGTGAQGAVRLTFFGLLVLGRALVLQRPPGNVCICYDQPAAVVRLFASRRGKRAKGNDLMDHRRIICRCTSNS